MTSLIACKFFSLAIMADQTFIRHFLQKNVGPTSSNIVRKSIHDFLSNMLDDVDPTCWTRFFGL